MPWQRKGNMDQQSEINVLNLPPHLIDLARQINSIGFGEVSPRFKIVNNRVHKLITTITNSLRFKSNPDAVLFIADSIKRLPTDRDGKIVLTIEHRAGQICRIETVTEEEVGYDR